MMRHQKGPPLAFLMLLIAFPQLNETFYAPALPAIVAYFHVTASAAQWTMSVGFFAMAFGVAFWGRMSDRWGRRPALLAALVCYGLGALLSWWAPVFAVLLFARALLMFGASAGSIVIQTMLRDLYQGPRLAAVYSLLAGMLALGPAIGPPLGSMLIRQGIQELFIFLFGFALVLFVASVIWGRETKPQTGTSNASYRQVWRRMRSDRHVWTSAWAIAGYNILLFGYYTLAPFTLGALSMPSWVFGISGWVIALASIVGAWFNRRMQPIRGSIAQIRLGWRLSMIGCLGQLLALTMFTGAPAATGFILFQGVITFAFGCAIPNVIADALRDYRAEQGTAGALLGLIYYLLMAAGLGALSTFSTTSVHYQPIVMLIVCVLIAPAGRFLAIAPTARSA